MPPQVDFSDLGGKVVQRAAVDFSDLGGKVVQSADSLNLPGSSPALRAAVAANPALQRFAQPTQFEQERNPANQQGFLSTLGSNLWSMAKGLPEAVVNLIPGVMNARAGEIGQQTMEEDLARQQAGRSLPYRGVAILGKGVGVNAPAMEQAAEVGNTRGVLGVAAANATPALLGPAIAEGARAMMPSRLSAPLAETMSKPRGTIPAEAATPAELQTYAVENNIPVNAAQVTEHNLPRNIQSAGERATVGGTAVRQQIKAAQAGVTQHAGDLMDQMSPNTPTVADAGEAIRSNIETALEREKQVAQANYAQVDQKANGVGVDLRPIKQEAANLLQQSSFVRQNASALDPKRASGVVQSITQLPDQASFSEAAQLRSALLDEARHPENAISQQGQGWIKKLSGTVDGQMQSAASQSPGVMSLFRIANEHWQGIEDAFNNPRSPLFQTLQELDPNKIPQKFIAKGQTGGSPFNVDLLDRYGIDTAPVKRMVLNDIYNRNFGLFGGKNLAGYSHDFLQSLYTPAELESIYKTGALARSVALNTNPSGTAAVTGAMEDVRHPIFSLGPKAVAAKATNSPGFNEWMTRTGPPSRSPALNMVPLSSLMTQQKPQGNQ